MSFFKRKSKVVKKQDLQNDEQSHQDFSRTASRLSFQPEHAPEYQSSSYTNLPGKEKQLPTLPDAGSSCPQPNNPSTLSRKLVDEVKSPAKFGNAPSVAGPVPNFRTQFAAVSLHMQDRLRLLNFPSHIVDLVRVTIQRTWQLGIQAERLYAGSYEFKFRGFPWRGIGQDSMMARRMIRCIYEILFNQGWVINFSTDVSKKQADIDTLVFRFQDPPPAPHEWTCVSFSRSDRVRLLDAPPDLCEAIAVALKPLVQSRELYPMPGVFELKLRGNPWRAIGTESMSGRKVVLQLVATLEEHGFTVYSSIDQKIGRGGDNGGETDTWHCCRRIGWQPGHPVFHG